MAKQAVRATLSGETEYGEVNSRLDHALGETVSETSVSNELNAPENARSADFRGRRVLAFESRQAEAMRFLIENCNGHATVVPSVCAVAANDSSIAQFVRALEENRVDIAIFTTGIGVRMLAQHIEKNPDLKDNLWLAALNRVVVVARGSKTVAALRALQIPVALPPPLPHTWRELIVALDARRDLTLTNRQIWVQEYGTPNRAFNRALTARGAQVSPLLVYRWTLPEDTTPILRAINAVIEGRFDTVLWTNGAQVWHVFQLAYRHGIEDEFRAALQRLVVASIGPSCTEALHEWEITPQLEAAQLRMSELVRTAAAFS